ncbi:MAG: FtsK/SpoIIIE domain-containing protein [Planctomycetota bacterium]|nr:FtsK/SpoIIIE domain-containing protein [Planctomycetota bacterium]
MTEGQFTDRQRRLLRELAALANRRAEAEEETERGYRQSGAECQKQHEEAVEAVRHRYESEKASAESLHRQTMKRIKTASSAEYASTKRAFDEERERIVEKSDANEAEARKQWEEAVWITETVYEANEHQPEERFDETRKVIEDQRRELHAIADDARRLMRKCRLKAPPPPPAREEEEQQKREEDGIAAAHALERALETARAKRAALAGLRLARLFRGYGLALIILLLLAAAGVLTAWLNDWHVNRWLAIIEGGAIVVVGLIVFTLYSVARRRARALCRPLDEAVQAGERACDACLRAAERDRDRLEAQLVEQRDRDVAAAKSKYEPIVEEIGQRRDHHLGRIDEKYPKLLERIVRRRDEEMAAARERREQRIAEIEQRCEEDSRRAEEQYARRTEERETRHRRAREELERQWKEGMARCGRTIETIGEESARLFPDWDDPAWGDWSPPEAFSPSIRFGRLTVDRRAIPGGIPEDERLATAVPETFSLPATLDFPDHCSLLLLTDGEGREQALQTLQTVMLRLLTSLPPGKVRFTILDPVGLGQNFAGFMHLADYEEAFVTSRIWTETRHIEQRLADLTEHMENVIQKYLRNEFESIADYNEHAGEIAEPYRFLVISDFPANFSDVAAQRLKSIVSSGARCGVHTLMTVDRRQQFPQGIALSDLEGGRTTLECKDGRFVWKDDAFRELPLTLEPPPPEEFVTHKLQLVGEASKDATRVEVPFAVVAPPPEETWCGDCSAALSVPLGRCGATKLQRLIIGPGTSQHALIAGKTGSGKSTLLHVLVTNLALWYSPDEVQFYLVDFKKGVEFKTYANHDLPHARAVAIESDREFGLSVLRRVDAELKYRGDRFRELGVQDLPGYRRLGLDEPMPRTLLIIDEFQEMFTEDDKIGQDAALLMDRLVRQGRAFGIHVLLGSQTLGGAYTLARSTIGQMQVRIALQCAEADSYLIMSDDNSAARLLSRPGEAIYNDAGGNIEGNSPFQIVWLPDGEREQYLKRVDAKSRERAYRRPERLIVFEGNVPADVRGNHLLTALLERDEWPADAAPAQAWLGDAIAIKGPTGGTLRRQSGSNLLLVGQRDESALAMISTALLSLAAQSPPGEAGARFYVLDGSPVDAPNAGFLERVASHIPHEVRHIGWREVDDAIAELAGELNRRQVADATDAPPIYLLVYGLQRFRMLRTSDDFGFSMGDEDKPPAADRMFGDLLRDGPPLGMHTIAWCDTAVNLNRTLDRHGLREFEQRVLFQMSGADSTQLIDSPLAAKLGLRRALFFAEEEGVLEKFRPYALPADEWLEEIKQRLAARSDRE